MAIDVLYQILLVVTIIAVIVLIFVLWKANTVLDDVKATSLVAKKRVKQLDICLDGLEATVNNASSAVKGFVSSLETGQKVKDKIKEFWSK